MFCLICLWNLETYWIRVKFRQKVKQLFSCRIKRKSDWPFGAWIALEIVNFNPETGNYPHRCELLYVAGCRNFNHLIQYRLEEGTRPHSLHKYELHIVSDIHCARTSALWFFFEALEIFFEKASVHNWLVTHANLYKIMQAPKTRRAEQDVRTFL